MNIIKQALSHTQRQNAILRANRTEIERNNARLSFVMLVMGCLFFVPFLVISFTVDYYRPLAGAYLTELSVLCLVLVFFPKIKTWLPSAFIIYLVYGTLIGYAIYTSAWVTPDAINVIVLFFLFQVPIITIDKSWRVNLIVVLYAAAYLIVVIPYKNPQLVPDEILNCLLFSSFGIGLGHALRSARLENYELRRQALARERIDYLTELENRKGLFDTLELLRNDGKSSTGILMVDIDHFKRYNDTFGHQAGDDCLRKISLCFRSFAAQSAITFYRYGGEEFVGVVSGISSERLMQTAEHLRAAVQAIQIPHNTPENPYVTVSIGVSTMRILSAPDDDQLLLSQADIALYAAKTGGRNRVAAFTEGMRMEHPCT